MGDIFDSLFPLEEEDQTIVDPTAPVEAAVDPVEPVDQPDPLGDWDPMADYKEKTASADRRTGEGVSGFAGDVVSGVGSGVIRGLEMSSGAMEWLLPEGSDLETGARETKEALTQKREDNTFLFKESLTSEIAREDSAWNTRGWFHGGMESLGMLAPAAATGLGVGAIGFQFWGGTAQESYDEAVENERQGIGKKLSETDKVIYSNLRGFWEGGIEAVQVAVASKIPALAGSPIFKKILPKTKKSNLIRSAVTREGNPILNVTKDLLKVVASEVPMELSQEYLGQQTAYDYGQSEDQPTWDSVKAVIGPTIVMSAVLGFAGNVSAASERKALHHALTAKDVPFDTRMEAVKAVYNQIKKDDPELATMWWDQTSAPLRKNMPAALPLDAEVRARAEFEQPREGTAYLKEALEVENAELLAKTEAKEEGVVATEAEKVGPAPEGMAQEQFEELITKARDAVNTNGPGSRNIDDTIAGVAQQQGPEAAAAFQTEVDRYSQELISKREQETKSGEPNAAGVVEPEIADNAQTISGLDRQIDQIETTIEANPKHPQIKNFQQGLAKLKADRAVLLSEQQTTPETTADQPGEQVVAPEAAPEAKVYVPQDTKRDPDFKETGNYSVGESGYKVSRDALRNGVSWDFWTITDPDGNILPHSENNYTKADAIARINEILGEKKAVEKKTETKYSAKKAAGELVVEQNAIPEDLEVTTKVTTADGKTTADTKFNGKKALASMDDLLSKLTKILECVKT